MDPGIFQYLELLLLTTDTRETLPTARKDHSIETLNDNRRPILMTGIKNL